MHQYQHILGHVPSAMLVIFRLGGLMVYGPVFGSQVVPGRVKALLALVLGLALYPSVARHGVAGGEVSLDLWTLGPAITMELLIGLIIGFIASIPLIAVQTGGLVMGQQMGLGFARFFNPAIDDEADIVGQMLFFLTLAGFLVIGGHESMVLAVLNSFEHVPLGGFRADESLIALMVGLLHASFEIALRVAAPLLAVIALESVAMGFIAKTVPQLNILSLGFPLRILMGFAIVAFALYAMSDVIMEEIDGTIELMFSWIRSI